MVAKCRWMRGYMDSLLMEAKGVLFGLGWAVQLQWDAVEWGTLITIQSTRFSLLTLKKRLFRGI